MGDIVYEVLKSKGLSHEQGRHGSGLLIIKYRGDRPEQYQGYESVFKGDPFQHMNWLRANQDRFPCLEKADLRGTAPQATVEKLEKIVVSTPESTKPKASWKKWAAYAVGAAAAGAGAAYLFY